MRKLGIYLLIGMLVLGILLLAPMMAIARGGDASQPCDAPVDPLGRLPSSPEEAHKKLLERKIGWPEDEGAEAQAASVKAGVNVSLPFNSVEGYVTNPGANVKVEVIRGATTIGTLTVKANEMGWFNADFNPLSVDIKSGDQVKVTDLADNQSVTINCVLAANIDYDQDKVSGTASGTKVRAYVITPNTYYGDVPPGAFSKEVSVSGGAFNVDMKNSFNLLPGDAVVLYSIDAASNKVMDMAGGVVGRLVVYPQYDEVLGYYYQTGTTITVNVAGRTRSVPVMGDGFFEAFFSDYNIKAGDKVTSNLGGAREITVRDVSATLDPATGKLEGTAPANRLIRVAVGLNTRPVVLETVSDKDGKFSVDLSGKYTVSGQEVFNVAWYDDDGDAVVYDFQTYSWYLAEGCTEGEFETWVLVQNPNNDPVPVTLTYMTNQGVAASESHTMAPNSRKSWLVNSKVKAWDVSTMVTSTSGAWIIAERAVYGKRGGVFVWGHDSIGVTTPAKTWYLAEGCTEGEFETWVLVQNPNDKPVKVTLTFMTNKGVAGTKELDLGARSRRSWRVNDSVVAWDVSTMVTAPEPVIAERAVYGKRGGVFVWGHDSIGVVNVFGR